MGGFVGDVGSFLGSAASAVVDPVSGLLNAVGVPSVGSAVAGIGSDVANIIGGGNAGTATQNAINQQDPLSANRQYFANQLMALYQNPSNYFATNPTYQFQMQQGTDAIMRNKAAQGNLVSGNTGAALEQYGQGLASQSYDTTLSQLTSLASGNPAFAQLQAGGSVLGQQQTQSGIAGLLSQFGNLFGGSSSSASVGSLLGGSQFLGTSGAGAGLLGTSGLGGDFLSALPALATI